LIHSFLAAGQTTMSDPETGIKDSDGVMSPLHEQQSSFKRSQAARSMRQARFLFGCSLVLVAALAVLIASNSLSDQARTPSMGVLVIVGVAVAITWQRYRKAKPVADQDHGPAA
jgi:FtsH-binding integral membrane protein